MGLYVIDYKTANNECSTVSISGMTAAIALDKLYHQAPDCAIVIGLKKVA